MRAGMYPAAMEAARAPMPLLALCMRVLRDVVLSGRLWRPFCLDVATASLALASVWRAAVLDAAMHFCFHAQGVHGRRVTDGLMDPSYVAMKPILQVHGLDA